MANTYLLLVDDKEIVDSFATYEDAAAEARRFLTEQIEADMDGSELCIYKIQSIVTATKSIAISFKVE